ncbi:hypothetical protein F2Q68_00034996 [Brassica cretica]|uniref:Uncharacterized protein n=1 Tax=Brassica cretica TaxID=69181 RepID=A0A8S9GYC5_BRACR|nr:hypothetical protein F2Q68_00034996 [Brassica cretica]
MLIDSWSPRLEEERHMKKLPSETKETRKVKEIFGLQEKKKNCWTFFAAAAQVYGGRIHESVESVEMISNYEIRVSLEFSRVQESATVFSEGFHGVLGLNLHGISVAGDKLIYMVFFSQREGCCRRVEGDRLMQIYLCVIIRVYNWVDVQRTRYYKAAIFRGNAVWMETCMFRIFCMGFSSEVEQRFFASKVFLASCAKRRDLLATAAVQSDVQGKGFWFEAVVIQVLQELQVSIDISWKLWRRRISRFVVTITTTTTSETEEETFTEDDLKARDGFRLKEVESNVINLTGTEGFSEITRNAACSSFSEVLRVTQKVSGCKKKARIVTKRNRVEQVVTTGCNPEDKGYEINTYSRSRKSLPQLVEACLEKLVKGSSFDTREAVREYLRSITGLDDERYNERPT